MKNLKPLADFIVEKGLQTGPFGNQLKAEEYTPSGIPVVMPKDISSGYIQEESIVRIPSTKAAVLKKHFLQEGDILFPRRGDLGRIGIATTKNVGWVCGTGCLRARLKTSVLPEYLHQYLLLPEIKQWLENNALGQTMLNLNTEIIAQLPVYLPRFDEQVKIASILTDTDHAIETTERLIMARERYFDGLAKQLLITDQMKSLKKAKLGAICDINKGTQLNKTDMIGNATYPVINGGTGPSGYTDQWNTDAYSIAISEGGNSCGYVNYMTEKFWSGGHCYTLKNVKINQEYLFHFLKANEKFIMALRVGSGLPNIQKKSLEKFEVHYPDKEAEQVRIAEILNTAKREIDLLKKLAESYRIQKRGLMQKLLSGEWRVAA